MFDRNLAREMFQFGKFVFLSSILWFLKSNLDNLLVGKFLGATMLGIYAVAFNIANFGSDYFGGRVYRVVYPAYSKLQGDTIKMKKAFLRVLKYIGLVSFPLCIGTLLLGSDFVHLTYGKKWDGILTALRVLSLLSISNLLVLASDSVLMAAGKSNISFWSVFMQVSLFFLLITPMAKFAGIVGVATVVVTASMTALVFQYYWVHRCLGVSVREFYDSISSSLIAAMVMMIFILFVKQGAAHGLVNRYWFAAEVITAIVSYAVAMLFVNRVVVKEMKEMVAGS
jgi:O-antigen/teichoic acid export membrane protein